MRNIVTILLICILGLLDLSAKEKIVQKSGSMPSWVKKMEQGTITASAKAETLDAAKDKCMSDIRHQIISSIAVNVTASENFKTSQITSNEVMSAMTQYDSNVNTNSAYLPFLTGISVDRVKDFYWEKYYDKEKDSYHYIYHMQYPFTQEDRLAWTAEFIEYDNTQYNKLKQLKENFKTFTDVAYISAAVSQLHELLNYFFDSVRKAEVETAIKDYVTSASRITIHPVKQERGLIIYHLLMDGRKMFFSKKPHVKSGSAYEINVVQNPDNTYTITYNSEMCTQMDDNSIEVSHILEGRRVKNIFYFTVDRK
jgi:hypothetical protein